MTEILKKLIRGENLSQDEAHRLILTIMDGKLSPVLTAGILVGLAIKGETSDEITGAVKAMREKATTLEISSPLLMDTCGTGGDEKGTFNFSTACAFVVSAGGVPVAKHGNRAVSSLAGSADLVEALGIPLEVPVSKLKEGIEKVKFGFLFAPMFHRAMKNVAPVRRELGVRTIFNLIGPLSNPASPTHQIVGVYSPHLVEIYAEVMLNLKVEGIVVHGEGYDEFTVTGENLYAVVKNGQIEEKRITPEALGLKRWSPDFLKGGSAEENAKVLWDIFTQREKGGVYEMTLLNAGFAFYACGKTESPEEGLSLAENLIKSEKVKEKLNEVVEFYKK